MKLSSRLSYDTSNNYKLFKRLKGNRKINTAHVNRLIVIYTNNPAQALYTPILINEKFEIVDGQHRFEAWKEIGVPVTYLMQIGLTLQDAIALNSGHKAWTPTDFANSYVEQGNEHYQTYLDFKHTYGLNHDILLKFLSLERNLRSYTFADGKFIAVDPDKSMALCEQLLSFKAYYKRWNYRAFAYGFYYLWSHPDYDHDIMLKKLEGATSKLQDRTSPEQYADILSDIYNTGNKNRIWFAKK